MSGPIVRKYGFPNFEQIFGKQEVQHGIADDPTSPERQTDSASQSPTGNPHPPTKDAPKPPANSSSPTK
jgi:hypothetical protein